VSHPHAELLREPYEGLSRGEAEGILGLLDPQVILHAPGSDE
jgi:hypothetical protein